MQEPSYISSLVEKAVKGGIPDPEPKRRRGKAAREAERRQMKILSERRPSDDSDFDDYLMSDSLWNRMYKHENKEYDQRIFNVFRQDKIDTQERKVNITTAICVRDCPEKAAEIAMWTRLARPVVSLSPKNQREFNKQPKRDIRLLNKFRKLINELKRRHAIRNGLIPEDPPRAKGRRVIRKKRA